MPKKWILYDEEDRQVEWPPCLKNLTPVEDENPLDGESASRLRESFHSPDIFDEILPSIKFLLILGRCSTSRYLQCPNIPEHHRENARCGPRLYAEDKADYSKRAIEAQVKYFNHIGAYVWVDFDVEISDGVVKKLRMVVNYGDADCNDGQWGEIWQRNNGKRIGGIQSVGDCETSISCFPRELEKVIDFVVDIVVSYVW